MGMFDEIQCKMPLPAEIGADHREHWFQTKSLDCCLEYYEIREDGTLWKRHHASEAITASVNWVPCDEFTGEIVFYTQLSSIGQNKFGKHTGWIEFSSYFIKGKLKHFELLELTSATLSERKGDLCD